MMRAIEDLGDDLRRLGVRAGDHLMVHASLRALGPVEEGPAGVVAALERAVGPEGTLMMVLGADGVPEWLGEPPGTTALSRLDPRSCFDPRRTPAHPDVGWLAEVLRRAPGTLVSDHPLGRFGARGCLAASLLEHVPWNDYYGPASPLERLCQAGGRVLRLGADPDTVTLLHWAEYLAPLPAKRRVRRYVAIDTPVGPKIARVDSLDDSGGIVDHPGDDYFALLFRDYLATGRGERGTVGAAPSELLDARDLVAFGVGWMERHLGPEGAPG
jgi:aminoglycoside N3'-acetyltransferase